MRVVSRFFPQQFRNSLRHKYDSLYSKSIPGKETIGKLSQWTIVTSNLNPASVVYSGGVGEDITFEEELIRRFGVKIYIFDPSPVASHTISRADTDHLLFAPVGLSASAEAEFSVGGGEGGSAWWKAGGSDVFACTTIPDEMEKNHHDYIDLLKIDIEGFEYDVLHNCIAAGVLIKQLCVEFHDFFPDVPTKKTKDMIKLLKSQGFKLIHRHRHDHTFSASGSDGEPITNRIIAGDLRLNGCRALRLNSFRSLKTRSG